jgi:hypothetical protein
VPPSCLKQKIAHSLGRHGATKEEERGLIIPIGNISIVLIKKPNLNSEPIITDVVNSNLDEGEVYNIM